MGYTLLQIGEILLKADRTMYKIGSIAYDDMFNELDETLDYNRDIIYIYKKAVEYADDFYVGTEKLDTVVEKLGQKVAVYDYGQLTPIYSDATIVNAVIPVGAVLNDLNDVTITNVQNNQILQYNSALGQWVNVGTNAAVRTSQAFTATLNQTVFVTTSQFTAPLLDVYLNGVRLNSSNYSTFGNYTITLYDGCLADDIVDVTIYDPFSSVIDLAGYVPYTGATTNVDLGEFELKAGQLTLDVSPTGTASVGTTRWNNTIGSSETTLKGGSVILKNGVDLVARVVNKVFPNATLTKAAYQAVRVSGAQGQRLAVAYAQANNDNNSADTIGLVTETIATNQEGFIITVGSLEDINTTGSLQGETWVDGDVLYLSPTTPGAITNVKPVAPQHIIIIGYVEYAHANNGKIYVKTMNGWELGELHDVNTTGAVAGQVLKYNGTIWTPSSDAGITGSGVAGQVAYWDGTNTQTGSNNLFWDNSNTRLGIATNTPSARFDVNGFIRTTSSLSAPSSGAGLEISYDTNGVGNITAFNRSTSAYAALRLNDVIRISAVGNTSIGSTTDSGQRLQVYGDTLLRGSGATSATNALLVQNSAGTQQMILNNAGQAMFGINTPSAFVKLETDGVFRAWTSIGIGQFGTVSINTTSLTKTASGSDFFEFANVGTHTAVNGTYYFLQLRNTINPTSGNAVVNGLNLNFTINQTGGANGITRGLYVNPTLTSAADFRAIETTAGNVLFGSNFFWDNANARLGIGTATPSGRVHIVSATVNDALLVITPNNNSTLYPLFVGGATLTSDTYLRANASILEFNRIGQPSTIRTVGAGTNNLVLQSGSNLVLNANGANEGMRITTSLNTLVGGIVDAGQKFQVYGDAFIKGSGNTSATNALLVQNSNGDALMTINNASTATFRSNIVVNNIFGSTGNNLTFEPGSSNNVIRLKTFSNATGYVHINNPDGAFTPASGNIQSLIIDQGFAPTSGTATMTYQRIQPTINQTGGANGITRGLYVNPTLTAAADWRSIEWSNNSGWGLYGDGSANNFLRGALGIGTTSALSFVNVNLARRIGGSSFAYGIYNQGVIQSDVTTGAYYFSTDAYTQAASFNVANIYHYNAQQFTFGAGSSATNQYAFFANASIIGATNNYGFYGAIPSGTNRWNLYMAGTANNYMAGNLLVGATTDNGSRFQVTGNIRIDASANNFAYYINGGAGGWARGYRFMGNAGTSYGGLWGVGNDDIASYYTIGSAYNVGLTVSHTTANVSIGSITDAGFKLDVNGTARVSSTFTASGVTAVAGTLEFKSTLSSIPGNYIVFNNNGNILTTSGITNHIISNTTYSPTSGTGVYNLMFLATTINQTGGANGITRGLYINPTLTAAADWRSIEWTNNTGWGLYGIGTAPNYLSSQLWVGTTSGGGNSIAISRIITVDGSSSVISNMQVNSGINTIYGFRSRMFGGTGTYTVSDAYHFSADLTAPGASSTFTNQYGFYASSEMTGATNNFGFRGDIPSGTGRWNLYMSGTADNYLAGKLGIGSTTLTNSTLRVSRAQTGSTSINTILSSGQINSDVTSFVNNFASQLITQAATFSLGQFVHFRATDAQKGAGSTIVNNMGFYCDDLTFGDNDYGFYGSVANGTNKWNLFMAGTADNYLAGGLSIGGGGGSFNGVNLFIARDITGAVGSYGVRLSSTIQSDVTTIAVGFQSGLGTAATTFNLAGLNHFIASQSGFGAGSTVAEQNGFHVFPNLIGAVLNIGFRSRIPQGLNRWNMYLDGTADNYLRGKLLINTTTVGTFDLDVNGTARVQGNTQITPPTDTTALSSMGYSVTGSGATEMINLSGTWNTTGAPTAIRLNITNTASQNTSRLIDLQVGGASQFSVDRNGICNVRTRISFDGLGNNIIWPAAGGSATATNFIDFRSGSSYVPTSGNLRNINVEFSFSPTSGTAAFTGFYFAPTINQTGGANGITRGLYINPTLTSAADWRAIEVSAGVSVLAPSSTASATLRIPSGTAPTSPVNGDIWFDGTDLKMRIGGVTKTFTLV